MLLAGRPWPSLVRGKKVGSRTVKKCWVLEASQVLGMELGMARELVLAASSLFPGFLLRLWKYLYNKLPKL